MMPSFSCFFLLLLLCERVYSFRGIVVHSKNASSVAFVRVALRASGECEYRIPWSTPVLPLDQCELELSGRGCPSRPRDHIELDLARVVPQDKLLLTWRLPSAQILRVRMDRDDRVWVDVERGTLALLVQLTNDTERFQIRATLVSPVKLDWVVRGQSAAAAVVSIALQTPIEGDGCDIHIGKIQTEGFIDPVRLPPPSTSLKLIGLVVNFVAYPGARMLDVTRDPSLCPLHAIPRLPFRDSRWNVTSSGELELTLWFAEYMACMPWSTTLRGSDWIEQVRSQLPNSTVTIIY
jgi:hypothetical protein